MMNSKSRNENSDADSQDGEYCSGREQESSTSTEDAQQTSVAHRAGAKVSSAARLAASASKGDESGCGTPTSTMRRQLRAMSQDNSEYNTLCLDMLQALQFFPAISHAISSLCLEFNIYW